MLKVTKATYSVYAGRRDKVLAKCNIVIEDQLMIRDISIRRGSKGDYITFPVRTKPLLGKQKREENVMEDVCHPVSKDFHKYLQRVVMEGYVFAIETGERVFEPGK